MHALDGYDRVLEIERCDLTGAYTGQKIAFDPQAGAKYAAHVAQAIELAEEEQVVRAVGAFIAEPLLGCGGQIVPPEGYLAAAYAHVRTAARCASRMRCRRRSAAWGRTSAFETQGAGVVPDMLKMGKPLLE